MADSSVEIPPRPRESLAALFVRFLRFGLLAWGGPAAQIAMIRQELVEEEKWLSRERFNRVLAVYQALPGPEAHELCVYFGMRRRGRLGGTVAGLGFMLPGFWLMLLLAWFYVTYGLSSPAFAAASYGFKPAIAALLVVSVYRIGRYAVTNLRLLGIAAGVGVLSSLGGNPLILLALGGLTYLAIPWIRPVANATRDRSLPSATRLRIAGYFSLAAALIALLAWQLSTVVVEGGGPFAARPSLPELFLVGLKAGLLTFGGAYTAIAFLQQDAVATGRWMTNEQFLDGLALHGTLPAPAVIVGTFVGYLAGGPPGSIVLTAGIFLPAFALTLFGHDHLERIVENRAAHAFLDGLTAGVVGLIADVALTLSGTALLPAGGLDGYAVLIFAAALVILYRWRTKAAVLGVVGIGALLGGIRFALIPP